MHSERVGAERPYNPPAAYRDLFGSTPATFPGCRPGPCGTAFLTAANRQIRAGADGRTLVSPDQLQRLVDLYDGGIRAADDQLRGLVADLSARGLAERTILVVLSDHGEEFLDHGAFLHTATQYEELTHVPLVLVVPGLGGGRRVRELASIVDVMPTLLALLGIDPGPHAQGHDLMPLVRGAGPVRAEALTTSSIHTSEWKLFPGRRELYDRRRDPTDRRNVAASHPEVVAALARRSAELVAECLRLRRQILGDEAGSPGSPPVLDKGIAAELEALGYLER